MISYTYDRSKTSAEASSWLRAILTKMLAKHASKLTATAAMSCGSSGEIEDILDGNPDMPDAEVIAKAKQRFAESVPESASFERDFFDREMFETAFFESALRTTIHLSDGRIFTNVENDEILVDAKFEGEQFEIGEDPYDRVEVPGHLDDKTIVRNLKAMGAQPQHGYLDARWTLERGSGMASGYDVVIYSVRVKWVLTSDLAAIILPILGPAVDHAILAALPEARKEAHEAAEYRRNRPPPPPPPVRKPRKRKV